MPSTHLLQACAVNGSRIFSTIFRHPRWLGAMMYAFTLYRASCDILYGNLHGEIDNL